MNETTAKMLPVLPTRREVVLPGQVMSLEVGRRSSIAAIDAAMSQGGSIVLVPQRDMKVERPTVRSLIDVGVTAEIMQVSRRSAARYTVMVRGLERARIEELDREEYFRARVSPLATVVPSEDSEVANLVARTRTALRSLLAAQAAGDDEPASIDDADPDDLVDLAASSLELERDLLIELLGEVDVVERLRRVLKPLERASEVLRVKADIEGEIADTISAEARERVLRQRLKNIAEELGEADDETEISEYLDRVAESKMTDEARKMARKQISKMRMSGSSSPEHTIARTYLEWLLDLPWGTQTDDTLDVPAARAILEADHAGLDKVKKRILEFIAVRKLAPDKQGPILCLVGPPGVGKTSLGRSIATALGRKYVRAALGGLRDDSEIRGHRRTYIGALPGRIVSGLKKAGSMNPVFVLDEIDKLARGMRGDPAAALLEVLDPEQNSEFVDHYLEVGIDLSKVMFIATANQLDTIPGPLLDRMEVIQIPGYTEREKLLIAKSHLLPKQMAEHGIEKDHLVVSEDALRAVIHDHTREAGVRNLEREIASLCRHAAVELAGRKGEAEVIEIAAAEVGDILGPARFFSENASPEPSIGVATGLGWMPTGGDLLFVEAREMPGKGSVHLTGQVGDVMEESATTAMSWVRANAERLGIDSNRFARSDMHVHLPAGAVKKDGPSAGLAVAIALFSLVSERRVRSDVAITGEITLRGRVLPVGGIKSKVLAAHRAGIHTIILPERNKKDMVDIPEELRHELDIRFVERIDEALEIALADGSVTDTSHDPAPVPPSAPPTGRSGGDRPTPAAG